VQDERGFVQQERRVGERRPGAGEHADGDGVAQEEGDGQDQKDARKKTDALLREAAAGLGVERHGAPTGCEGRRERSALGWSGWIDRARIVDANDASGARGILHRGDSRTKSALTHTRADRARHTAKAGGRSGFGGPRETLASVQFPTLGGVSVLCSAVQDSGPRAFLSP
jgi:hypothetical protein